MMYVLLVLILILALVAGLYLTLSWSLAETPEDSADERIQEPRSYYDPRSWAAYHFLLGQKPVLISSRRTAEAASARCVKRPAKIKPLGIR
jgi:hypothetical protein